MKIKEALDIFKLTSITDETSDSLKKKFKRLMIKHHPDNNIHKKSEISPYDVQEAYNILKELLSMYELVKIKNRNIDKPIKLLTLHDLIDIYNGKDRGESGEINKQNLNRFTPYIITTLEIQYNGLKKEEKAIQLKSLDDTYEIQCDIQVENITDKANVKIFIGDIEREISFNGASIRYIISLDFNIKVHVVINKKIKSEEVDNG